MLRVLEQYAGSDTGLQRRANEDSLLARAPLFVVADGMGGAQAGEVASRLAIESFQPGLPDGVEPESALAELAQAANARIHELSHSNAEQAGMGTTLTALYVAEQEVAIAHVGDSRAYCLRDGELLRLTDDHSLVDELMRQGRLTPEEAVEHPQRSVITRALGPEGVVEVDTRTFRARAGDVYLLCSDGLTTMLSEPEIAAILRQHERLRDAGEALIAAANAAGGRDNITVVLVRLGEFELGGVPVDEQQTMVGLPAVDGAIDPSAAAPADAPAPADTDAVVTAADLGPAAAPARGPAQAVEAPVVVAPPAAATRPADGAPVARRTPRMPAQAPGAQPPPARAKRRRHRAGVMTFLLVTLLLVGSAAYLTLQSVYFVGTNDRGLVTMFEGLPYRLPGGINLYSSQYVSGVSASALTPAQRRRYLNNTLRSESEAGALVHSIELGQIE